MYCIAQHVSDPHEVMSMVGRIFLGLLMMFAVQSAALAAPEPDSPDGWNARGVQYRKQGQNEKALDAFRHAHDMAASPRSVGQMGFVEHDLGQYVAAERHLTEALSAAADPWVSKNRLFLNEALMLARKHLARLTITGPPGAMVTVGGELAGVLPLAKPISLAEGTRSIEVTSAGYLPWKHEAVLTAGDSLELAADLVPER
jgi:tetratricopeptide (TPR) repeat protein